MGVNTNTVIKPKQIITIFNILRDIGLNTSHRGTKYLSKAVQILIITDNDIVKSKIFIIISPIFMAILLQNKLRMIFLML